MTLRSTVRFAFQRKRFSTRPCEHLAQIQQVTRGSEGCEQCVALGDTWVHLRMCMTCGLVGCDSSKNKHAHRHADQIGDPVARPLEPGENRIWCYVDETMVGKG